MKCVIIHNNITSQGECSENYSFRTTKFKYLNVSKRLWRGSQNQRVLLSAYRRGKSESGSVQEVGEIQ